MSIKVIPGEISTFTIAVAILSGFILFFGCVSMFLKERLFLSEALVAVVVGIIAGPLVTNGFNPYSWEGHDEITKQLTRCIIAIQVMAVGIELPKHYLKKEWLTMTMLLMPVMMFMWLISGLFIWGLVPPINYLEALVISACVCPTDPILANSVVKGRFAEKHVPAHIRNALSAESGINDGMGFPFLFLAIFLISEEDTGTAIGKWLYITCLFQIALSCIIGVVVGFVARKVLQWSERNHLIDKPSFLAFAIALSLFLMSMTGFSGSDDLLACFAAGSAFSWDDWFRHETEEAHFQEVIDMMLNLAIFVYIGAIIPWSEFGNEALGLAPWRLVVIGILVLLFRRLPIVLLLKPVMPAIKTYREAIFSGWFGPMGVGAVFLSTIAKESLEEVYKGKEMPVSVKVISPVVLFIVFCSVIVHGTTIPLFKLGKRIRTRTLSISSIGSNQVLRLPKLQFGHQLNGKRGMDEENHYPNHQQQQVHTPMTELQRNTLFNTLQYSKDDITTISMQPSMPHRHLHRGESDSDIAEEDFLPDDTISDHDVDNEKGICGSAISLDAQHAIRFVEPLKKPRNSTPVLNQEKVDSLAPSLKKTWLRHSIREDDEGQRGIKHLFKRFHASTDTGVPTLNAQEHCDSRIDVWEEGNHDLVQAKQNIEQAVVIDKQNDWKHATKEAIKKVETNIRYEEEGGSPSTTSSVSASSSSTKH